MVLLEAWKSFEEEQGSAEDVQKVQEMMPKVMKKWRQAEDGSGLEECEFSTSTRSAMGNTDRYHLRTQTGTWSLPTTRKRPIRRVSSSSRLHRNGAGTAAIWDWMMTMMTMIAATTMTTNVEVCTMYSYYETGVICGSSASLGLMIKKHIEITVQRKSMATCEHKEDGRGYRAH